MNEEIISIPVGPASTITSRWCIPDAFESGQSDAVILAHGAGNDMHHAFMRTYQDGLTHKGVLTLTFNFPYKELGRKAPDPPAILIETWRKVADALRHHPRLKPRRTFLGGKSMGGRIASLAVAEGLSCDGLIFLGYPLHPPKQPEKTRIEHWPNICCPTLFIEGTRDTLCDLSLLENALPRLGGPSLLHLIEGGDHSFKLPKSHQKDPEAVHREAIEVISTWMKSHDDPEPHC